MAWFKRESGELDTSGEKKIKTEGLWVKCEDCRQIIWKKDLEDNLNVCPKCDKHFRIDARTRLAQLIDDNQFEVFDANLVSTDPLKFVDLKPYASRLKQARKDTELTDAVIAHILDRLMHANAPRRRDRLGACARCRRVFYDNTRSHTRRWCSYATCGNRANVAAYRNRTRP